MHQRVYRNSLSVRFPLLFLAVMCALMGGYHLLPPHWVEDVLVHYFAVVPGAAALDFLTPTFDVVASGNRIVSPMTRLNVLKGCEGVEMLLLLYAAVIAVGRPLRISLIGLVLGTLLIFFLNLLRIITLFFISRSWDQYFELMHGLLAPMLIVAITTLFFLYWLRMGEDGSRTNK